MAKVKKTANVIETAQDGGIPIPEEIMPALIESFIMDSGSDNVAVFGGRFEGGIHCQQVPDELAGFIKFMLDAGSAIQSYLEISISAGGTACVIAKFLNPENIVVIDNNRHWAAAKRAAILNGIGYLEIVGNSRSPETIARAGSDHDIVFIDGERTYEGVMADAKNFIPLVRPGGFVAIHDSTLEARGITQAVNELKEDPGLEFVTEFLSTKRAPLGIALFRKVVK
ncbi:MAG: class I SAM-dependent methyltransferase [Syntrophaceae bacterium]